MKQLIFLVLTTTLIFQAACNKGDSSSSGSGGGDDNWSIRSAYAICDKMETCMKEKMAGMEAQMKNLPPEARKMMEAQMPTAAKCRAEADKSQAAGKADYENMSDEEKTAARKCAEAIPAASCDQIMTNTIAECKEIMDISKRRASESH